jgi:hypothetical protein
MADKHVKAMVVAIWAKSRPLQYDVSRLSLLPDDDVVLPN